MRPVFVDTSGIVAAMNARDEHHAEARKIFHDATSFVVARHLGIDTAIAFDAHFRQYGLKVLDGRPL